MRKISLAHTTVPPLLEPAKTLSHSLSTEESPRERLPLGSHKEKSQLCKKFVEQGYCPYEKRCKFAHGLQELKKNHQANCKYKTKVCGGFLQEGFCPYGNRCNFIHPPSAPTHARELDADLLVIRL
jgi:hypothetical protein